MPGSQSTNNINQGQETQNPGKRTITTPHINNNVGDTNSKAISSRGKHVSFAGGDSSTSNSAVLKNLAEDAAATVLAAKPVDVATVSSSTTSQQQSSAVEASTNDTSAPPVSAIGVAGVNELVIIEAEDYRICIDKVFTYF